MSRGKRCPVCFHDTVFASPDGGLDKQCSECGHILKHGPISRLVYGRCPTKGCSNGGPQYFSSGVCVRCESVIIPEEQYQEMMVKAEVKVLKPVGVSPPVLRQREGERVVVGTEAGQLRSTPTPQHLTKWFKEK